MKTKKEIREHYRDVRKNISMSMREKASKAAAALMMQHPQFKQSRHIGCYMANNDEFETRDIIKEIWQADKHCYLPTLNESKSLDFVRYHEGDKLSPNQFNILEPENTSVKILPEHLELIIVPLIAFDLTGKRLGSGGGYYDRTFAFLHSSPKSKPYLLGLAYSQQRADVLPADPWDVHLDGVMTEEIWIGF